MQEKPAEAHHTNETKLNAYAALRSDFCGTSPSHTDMEMNDAADIERAGAEVKADDRDETRSVAAGIATTTVAENEIVAKLLCIIGWMPSWCRYDPRDPPKFTLSMNLLLAFVRDPETPFHM